MEENLEKFFGDLEFQVPDLEKGTKEMQKNTKELMKLSKESQDKLNKLIKAFEAKIEVVKQPKVSVTHERVDLSGFKSDMALCIQKQLKIEQGSLDDILADAVLLIHK